MNIDGKSYVCGECTKFLGIGDWDLCCKEKHDSKEYLLGLLCYEDTPACDKFKPIDKLTEEEFYNKYCFECGSQRCEGIGTKWFDGYRRYRYKLDGYVSHE